MRRGYDTARERTPGLKLAGILEATFQPTQEQVREGVRMVWEYSTAAGPVFVCGDDVGQWLLGEGDVTDIERAIISQNRPNLLWWQERDFSPCDYDGEDYELPVYGARP